MAENILIIAEHLQGQVQEITHELVARARQLAAGPGAAVEVLLLGGADAVDEMAGALAGADRILVGAADHLAEFTAPAYTEAAAAVIAQRQPRLVLLGHTSQGMDLAPALSAALGWPLVACCNAIAWEAGAWVATANLYGGRINVEVAVGGPAVLTVLTGAAPNAAAAGAPAVERVDVADLGAATVRVSRLIEPEAADVDITRLDILVSVGRGIGDNANIELAEELAAALGGGVAASRPVIDNGWLPRSRQVGKSGLSVAPRCYIAVGISGAPEHLEGIKGNGLVIAVNTDAAAPIFAAAQYGTTCDALDLLPALLEKIEAQGAS